MCIEQNKMCSVVLQTFTVLYVVDPYSMSLVKSSLVPFVIHIGFTVNNTTISVVEAHARRNRVLLYKTNYWVTDLNDVMKFIQYVYSHIHSRDEVLTSFETLSLHDEDQPESQQNTLKVALKSAILGLLDVVEKID